ncbi:MAG: two-component system nitrogen regulation response regulator GlnG [Myxococcota bacterium]|jgi:two-component system nitrogen regulation response regulator GlnG
MTDPTTIDSTLAPEHLREPPGLTFTVLWHPDLSRVGASAAAPFARASLSRKQPVFSDGSPLADARVSRSPLRFFPAGAGITVRPERPGQRFVIDGQPGVDGMKLSAAQLSAGVIVGLGRQGPLVLVESDQRTPLPARHGLVGSSAAMDRVRSLIRRFAPHNHPVLIVGPTGTGKEVVCRALHAASLRSDAPLVGVNMATLSPGTANSELFGHARGSFTGATAAVPGLFVQADGGTLLLDEVGACSVDVQAHLLRTLETGTIRPVGGRERAVDVRLLAATDAHLDKAISAGQFRSALYYRLAHCRIELPALAARKADIIVQFLHFLHPALGTPLPTDDGEPWLSRHTAMQLLRHPWPGNTRQLRAMAHQAAILYGDVPVCGPLALEAPAEAPDSPGAPPQSEDARVLAALTACDYRIREASETLGVSRNTLRRKMAAMAIPRAQDLTEAQIQRVWSDSTDIPTAARALRVSAHGLKLRITELGLSAD